MDNGNKSTVTAECAISVDTQEENLSVQVTNVADDATGHPNVDISIAADKVNISEKVTKLDIGSGDADNNNEELVSEKTNNEEENLGSGDATNNEEHPAAADTIQEQVCEGNKNNASNEDQDKCCPNTDDTAANGEKADDTVSNGEKAEIEEKKAETVAEVEPKATEQPQTNVDDDESDGEIIDSDVPDDDSFPVPKSAVDYVGIDVRPEFDQLDYDEDVDDGEIKSDEVTKPAEIKTDSKEMSDGEIGSSDGEVIMSDSEKNKLSLDKRFDDFEEGEMVDPSGRPTVPREICRFFERGNCTYGDRCRFIHPGINDKGAYNMFQDEKPRPKPTDPPARFPLPADPRGPPMPPNFPPPMMMGPPLPETAWERGLRHAKEMRRRAMQRKVEEPDFMRKREVLSLNEANNVDRDMDFIAHKPLADEERIVDPMNVMEEDERYAVPSLDEVKKYKRFDKSRKENRRSPSNDMRRPSPSREHYHREAHDRSRDRRSPPRHSGGPPNFQDRHQPMPPSHHASPHMRHEYRDRRDVGGDRGRHERDYRDRRMNDHMKDRGYRMEDKDYPMMDSQTSPKRRDVESRVVPVQPQTGKRKNSHSARGDTWSDPWARGRQSTRRDSRSDSESSGSSSSSSRSSYSSRSDSSYSSRSSSRSSYSSSFSSSGSSRSPSPKTTFKNLKKKKVLAAKAAQKAKDSPKLGKSSITSVAKQPPPVKKTAADVKAKLTKNIPAKPPIKPSVPTKPAAKETPMERGRPPVKTTPKKGKPKKKYDSSSSSEFSHSSSSESRSRSRGKGSGSESDSGSSSSSSSGSDSYSSSSSSSSGSSDEDVKKPKTVKKKVPATKSVPSGAKKTVAKVPVPSKPGNKNLKMTINDKATTAAAKSSTLPGNRKRPAAAMENPPAKKGTAIASRRYELLEQLKVVENAILKKRSKLT